MGSAHEEDATGIERAWGAARQNCRDTRNATSLIMMTRVVKGALDNDVGISLRSEKMASHSLGDTPKSN